MEVSGVDNKNTIRFNIDKKVYYSFLNTPLDKVQISSQNSEQKDNVQNKDMKEVADLLDPKKNYKRLAAKIAGIAGASVLIGGLTIAALFRGKSGMARKMGNLLQRFRGEAYNLQNETSFWAKIRYHFKTKVVNMLEKGLNTWVNIDQFKNRFLDKKIVENMGIFNRPIKWTVTKFENAAKARSMKLYKDCDKKLENFKQVLGKFKEVIKNGYNDSISENEIKRLNENFKELDLGLQKEDTRADVIEKIGHAVDIQIKKLTNKNEFEKRQKLVNNILEKLSENFDTEFKLISDKSGFLESFKHGWQAVKKLSKSGDELLSRKNLQEFEKANKATYGEKEKITRNVKNNYEINMQFLKQVESCIEKASKGNENLRKRYTNDFSNHIRQLENTMKSYKDAENKAGENYRKKYIETFNCGANSFIESIQTSGYNSDGKLNPAIENLEEAMNRIGKGDKKGLLEELRIFSKCYGEESGNKIKDENLQLYTEFKKVVDELSDSINKAVNFETNNLTFRNMDLKLGGGNFELIGLSIPVGIGAYNIAQADSHDERVSKGIRTGSVIGGGLAGWIFSSVTMCWSAGLAIMFGLGSGLASDKVGKFIDNKFWSKGRDWDAVKKQKQQESTVAYKA
ncbi:MAG: hypothetical protein PHC34_07330 [Candidatus Gastranaerophilales bacterium]|nr:hypothetical protein [Candidatus Gastranaerophilales bacterium]